ncbi:MAG: hypothetical protein MRY78_18360 [Saprospiraceae bacterium]|nr:hypothetical protein [Saprospiraceae bacterium]
MAEENTTVIDDALSWVKKKGYSKIKASGIEDLESPSSFMLKEEAISLSPEITAVRNGRKSYFDIASKEEDKKILISKWKLMEQLARIKNGNFFIFVPFGLKAFTERICKKHNINAQLVSL